MLNRFFLSKCPPLTNLFPLQAIEKELLERLKAGTYGDIPNVPWRNYERVLDMEAEKGELQDEAEEEDEEVRHLVR